MRIPLRRIWIALATLMSAVGPVAAAQDCPFILTTPSYVITIRVLCEEGVVDCRSVEYTGLNKRTGATIHLEGQDWIRYCADDQGDGPGKTPCEHIGFEFRSGDTIYYLRDDGTLEVVRAGRHVLLEKGEWDYGQCP